MLSALFQSIGMSFITMYLPYVFEPRGALIMRQWSAGPFYGLPDQEWSYEDMFNRTIILFEKMATVISSRLVAFMNDIVIVSLEYNDIEMG